MNRDVRNARKSLVDELESLTEYNERLEETMNPNLKDIFINLLHDEEDHSLKLKKWLNKHDTEFIESFSKVV